MSDGNEIEKVPSCNIFAVGVRWTLEQMLQARDFEIWIDQELAKIKHAVLQVYHDYGPPPKFFPSEDEDNP